MTVALPFVGHGEAEQAFLSAHVSGKLHHAWLIEGPAGIGKSRLAFRLAAFILGARGPRHYRRTGARPESLLHAQACAWRVACRHHRLTGRIEPERFKRLAQDAGRTSGFEHHVSNQSRLKAYSSNHTVTLQDATAQSFVR